MTSSSLATLPTGSVETLVIGAGPFGLALAARLEHHGIGYRIVGDSMSFWRHSMPSGMYLRSSWDWHLDSQANWTIERFLESRQLAKSAVHPIPIATYLDYVEWFRCGAGIEPENVTVARLDRRPDNSFVAELTNGETRHARTVVLALGFSSFADEPSAVISRLPGVRVTHTLHAVDFSAAAGRRYLIVGGRQSAFEWAALLGEAGAASVDIVHRHPTPAFAEANWTWVPPLMEEMVANPGWFRSLSDADKEKYRRRLWGEGRLKIEPWLKSRIESKPVNIWPETEIIDSSQHGDIATVWLSNGASLQVDQIILATGYRPDIGRIPLLRQGNLLPEIAQDNGIPLLDTSFQTSVAGLYMTSLLANRDFGPFFGFTVAARGAATVLGDDLARRLL
ncbi:MAG: NAD(P)-binding domain-containing protein [Thermomicrobiales bacterium]